jgi:hypothetical protein
MSALFRDYHFLPFRLGFALTGARVPPPAFFFNALSFFHGPLELCCFIYRFRYVPTPTDRISMRVRASRKPAPLHFANLGIHLPPIF